MLSEEEKNELLATLQQRFSQNTHRHQGLIWEEVEAKLQKNPNKIWSLYQMEKTFGEPDVIGIDEQTQEFIFCDCSKESPKGRRSLCYDREAQQSRKEFAPENNVIDVANQMKIELLNEAQYRALQTIDNFDMKTSSWLQTPEKIRKLGGAVFADFRYDTVFVYHNGAQSYYAARGFRGLLKV